MAAQESVLSLRPSTSAADLADFAVAFENESEVCFDVTAFSPEPVVHCEGEQTVAAEQFHLGELPADGEDGAPLYCRHCMKRFQQVCNLKQHERTHTGARPYECDVCGKRFKQLGHKQTHMRSVHTGERPYHCPVETCRHSFHQLGNLNGHLARCHSTQPRPSRPATRRRRPTRSRLVCSICSATYMSAAGLNHHLSLEHGISVTTFADELPVDSVSCIGDESESAPVKYWRVAAAEASSIAAPPRTRVIVIRPRHLLDGERSTSNLTTTESARCRDNA